MRVIARVGRLAASEGLGAAIQRDSVRPRRDHAHVSVGEQPVRARDRLRPREYGFGPLLVVILVSLIFQLAAPESDWARFVTLILQGATLLLALRVSGTRRVIVHVAR